MTISETSISALAGAKAALLGVALLTLAACATAPSATTATMADAKPASEAVAGETQVADASGDTDPNKMICKRQTVVGSNFKRKVCATQASWDAAAEQGRESARRVQSASRPTGSNN